LLNRRRSKATTWALAAILNLHPVFGQVANSTKSERPVVGLPAGAALVAIRTLPASAHRDRVLALWVLNPQEHSRPEGEIYTPNAREAITTRDRLASPWLINTTSGEIINTVRVTFRSVIESGGKREEREEDKFDIPYQIRRDLYRVDERRRSGEGN